MSCQLDQTGGGSSRCACGMPHAVAPCQPADGCLLCYAVGPYPDEVIMLALDRILYYLGATKILHQLELSRLPTKAPVQAKECAPPAPDVAPAPCTVTSSTSTCSLMGKIDVSKCSSNSSISKFTTAKSKSSVKDFAVPMSCSQGSRSSPRRVTTPACVPRPRTPRVDFAHPVADSRLVSGGPSISDRMKQSLSTCSLACRRLRHKLTANSKNQSWVWTRLVHSENGMKIYEVYQNSGSEKKPWKKSGPKQQPVIVFLVLPNGHVMPFETVSSNFAE